MRVQPQSGSPRKRTCPSADASIQPSGSHARLINSLASRVRITSKVWGVPSVTTCFCISPLFELDTSYHFGTYAAYVELCYLIIN
jgi:hypothetical protein